MEKLGTRGSPSHVTKRVKQTTRSHSEEAGDRGGVKDTLAKKLSEMNAIHETIFDDQNRLIQENSKLTQELLKLKEENERAIAMKNQEIEKLKKEMAEQCGKLERDINQVDSLVKKNKELEKKNREIEERDCELNRQLREMQERLVTKDKVIRMKTTLVQSKQREVIILKEKTEQLLHIYEKSMKDELRNISNICSEICNQSTSVTVDDEEEKETPV